MLSFHLNVLLIKKIIFIIYSLHNQYSTKHSKIQIEEESLNKRIINRKYAQMNWPFKMGGGSTCGTTIYVTNIRFKTNTCAKTFANASRHRMSLMVQMTFKKG